MEHNPNGKLYRLLFTALVAGSLIFHIAILWESRHKIAAGYGDFLIFYTGAQIVNDGRGKELFKVEVQNTYQAKFEDVPQLEWPLPFNHAPYELAIFLPMVRLSYPAAHLIWSAVNVLLLILMLRWMLPYINSPDNWLVTAALAAWFPTMEALRMGQDSILSTALLLGVFITLKQQREARAGVLLALGLYKPQLVLPLAGALLMARCWRTVLVFAVTGAALTFGSVLMVGMNGVWDLLSILRSMEDFPFIIFPPNMPNIRGLVHTLLHGSALGWSVPLFTVIMSLGLYGVCLTAWRRTWNVNSSLFDLQFGLIIVTTLLMSYHLYAHDLLPLSLALMLIYRHVYTFENRGAAVFYFLLLVFFLPFVPRLLVTAKLFSWAAVPILGLYAFLLWLIFARRSRSLAFDRVG